jgi:hypothetical protein
MPKILPILQLNPDQIHFKNLFFKTKIRQWG